MSHRNIKTRECLRWLRSLGFALKRTTGGHAQYEKEGVLVTVPVHLRELPNAVMASIRRTVTRLAAS